MKTRSGWAASCTAQPCWARCGRSAPKRTTCAPVGVSVHCLLLVVLVHTELIELPGACLRGLLQALLWGRRCLDSSSFFLLPLSPLQSDP